VSVVEKVRGPKISRRRLLVGGAAAVATQALGLRTSGSEESYDLCVIGSGFAGIPLALRTVKQGMTTVVVEAGPELAPSFEFATSGEVKYPIAGARQITDGGTSAHWTGVVSRMWPGNFHVFSEFGSLVDWPIEYEDLADYYCQSEKLLLATGSPSTGEIEPPRSCAYPEEIQKAHTNPTLKVGEHKLRFFTKAYSKRGFGPVRLADVEIPEFSESPLGTFVTGQRVTNIVTEDGESISYVVVQSKGGDISRIHAKQFVIAAGVIESPRLLLMSRSRWFPQGLGNANDLVGRHFCHHPHLGKKSSSVANGDVLNGTLLRSHSLDDTLHGKGLNAFNIQLNTLGNHLDVNIDFSPDTEPHAENRLTLLSNRRDTLGHLLPNLHVDHTMRDQKTFRFAREIGEQISEVVGGKSDGKYWYRYHSHPSGMTRMSSDASMGVVDRNNRVFGLDNLYISGACVFPLAGATNPTDTVVAMALRLADHLIERHRSRATMF